MRKKRIGSFEFHITPIASLFCYRSICCNKNECLKHYHIFLLCWLNFDLFVIFFSSASFFNQCLKTQCSLMWSYSQWWKYDKFVLKSSIHGSPLHKWNFNNVVKNAVSGVLVAVNMKSSKLWGVTPYGLVEVYRLSEEHSASVFRVQY